MGLATKFSFDEPIVVEVLSIIGELLSPEDTPGVQVVVEKLQKEDFLKIARTILTSK